MIHESADTTVENVHALRRVVLATDFSPRANHALRRVQYLPLALSAEVILAHVLPLQELTNRAQISHLEWAKDRLGLQAEKLRMALERLGRLRTPEGSGRTHVKVRPMLLSGDPALEIAKIAQSSAADVVVIGKHGAGKIKDLLLGSTAEKVIHDCHMPLLIVGFQPYDFYARPLIALPSDAPSRVVVDTGLRLVPEAPDRVDIVTAVAVPMEGWLWAGWASTKEILRLRTRIRDRARRDLERMLVGIRCRLVMRDGDPREIVPSVANKCGADLIVVGTHAAPGMVRFRLVSIAVHIVRHAPCDVLVVRMTE